MKKPFVAKMLIILSVLVSMQLCASDTDERAFVSNVSHQVDRLVKQLTDFGYCTDDATRAARDILKFSWGCQDHLAELLYLLTKNVPPSEPDLRDARLKLQTCSQEAARNYFLRHIKIPIYAQRTGSLAQFDATQDCYLNFNFEFDKDELITFKPQPGQCISEEQTEVAKKILMSVEKNYQAQEQYGIMRERTYHEYNQHAITEALGISTLCGVMLNRRSIQRFPGRCEVNWTIKFECPPCALTFEHLIH